ncbi:Protein tssc1 [Gaertneriomyces sp. JEL0708]|nr:Protein tssc1 [Gaertneriomyces sp. JEL0708]
MGDEERLCVYGLKDRPARCLKAQLGESERNRFFVGTQDLKHSNELHLIDFDEDEYEITHQKFPHQHEIWDIAPSPAHSDLVVTCYKDHGVSKASLWRLQGMEDSTSKLKNTMGQLDEVVVLETGGREGLESLNSVLWEPSGTVASAIGVGTHALAVYSLDQASPNGTPLQVIDAIEDDQDPISCAGWSPHGTNQITIASGTTVTGCDLRTPGSKIHTTFSLRDAHAGGVRDLDHNPNKPYHLATAGNDCMVRFWDTRKPDTVLKEISNHTHWIWCIAFNRFHDQLFLSSSSDGRVNLQNIISISSAPTTDESSDDDASDQSDGGIAEFTGKPTDGLVSVYDQHEDSVYSVEWSAADPWIFASVSYDGRVAVNVVPKDHKYKIIL